MKNKKMMIIKMLLVVTAVAGVLVLGAGQINRWLFRRQVIHDLSACYPDDKFYFVGKLVKEWHYWGPLDAFGSSFNPTGGQSHPLYWYKYTGRVASERLGMTFGVAGKPGYNRSAGNWGPAYYHEDWTELPDWIPDRMMAEEYEYELELQLAMRVDSLLRTVMPGIKHQEDYILTRDLTLMDTWWRMQHVSLSGREGYLIEQEGVPAAYLEPSLHSRLHMKRNFKLWLFCDPADSGKRSAAELVDVVGRLTRSMASELGLGGSLCCKVIDREAFRKDAWVWYDLMRSYHSWKGRMATYEDWPEKHRDIYDAIKEGRSLTDSDRKVLGEVLERTAGILDRLDKYIIGHYQSPLAADACVEGADFPPVWIAGMDKALQEEIQRIFGPKSYGRFEPYSLTAANRVTGDDLCPREGWQATVYVLADSAASLPAEGAARHFAGRLAERTGVTGKVDVYCLNEGELRYADKVKEWLISANENWENSFFDLFFLGVSEALYRDSLCVYDYVELSHSGYEGEFNDNISDDVVQAYYRLMRPRADLDVMKEVADGKLPLILRHYRVESSERRGIGPRAAEPDKISAAGN